ncbi:MAG: hypothetical protein ACRDCE_04245 [Cetobacterium sp.]|uniref:hypothetical protein n=1 Tax=Cetobacterium sp. TaxID=2071632 RepID=UPI003EE437D2
MNEKSVVYLIIYTGEKLPPYYIGSTFESKFLNENYHGSPASKKWKDVFVQEFRDNPHLFHREILSIHETRHEALIAEYELQLKLDVVSSPDFYNESLACPNGFFGNREIAKVNAKGNTNCMGRIWANDGNKSFMIYPHELTSTMFLGRCKYDKSKISESVKEKKKSWMWITNELDDVRVPHDSEIPSGWRKGRSKTLSTKMVAGRKRSFKWFNDGYKDIRVYDTCDCTGLTPGRIKGKRK